MKVSVVIPCRNEKAYIALCLDSLVKQDFPKEDLQVIVCDGLSDDGTVDIILDYAAKYDFIKYVCNPDQITPKALNLGLKYAAFDVGIILGAHAALAPDYISRCLEALNIDPQIGCVGGIIENVHENIVSESIGLAMSSPFGVGNAHFRTAAKDGYVDTVAFGAYRKEVFEKCGYFDETLVRNQDDEFNYRILKMGFKIWLSHNIRCVYYVRASFSKLNKQYFQYGYWKVFVNRKHKAVTTVRQLVPAIWILYLSLAWIPSLFFCPWIWLYAAGILSYLLGSFYFAQKLSADFKVQLRILRAFYTLHFAYGFGYILGIFDFILCGKNPSEKSTELSR